MLVSLTPGRFKALDWAYEARRETRTVCQNFAVMRGLRLEEHDEPNGGHEEEATCGPEPWHYEPRPLRF